MTFTLKRLPVNTLGGFLEFWTFCFSNFNPLSFEKTVTLCHLSNNAGKSRCGPFKPDSILEKPSHILSEASKVLKQLLVGFTGPLKLFAPASYSFRTAVVCQVVLNVTRPESASMFTRFFVKSCIAPTSRGEDFILRALWNLLSAAPRAGRGFQNLPLLQCSRLSR